MNLIDKIIVKYMLSSGDKVFYASLLTLIERIEDKKCLSMGVGVIDGQVKLYYNPDFIDNIRKNEGVEKLKGVIEHELLHIVFNHISRAKKHKRFQMIYNIATDIAINPQIKKETLPKDALFPSSFKLPNNKDAEWYYNELIKRSNRFNGKGNNNNNNNNKDKNNGKSGTQTLDDHSGWQKSTGNEQMIKESVKKIVNEAYQNTKKMRGTIPSSLEEAIKELLKPPTIDWRHLLKQYIGANIKSGFRSSWKRPNRRFIDSEEFKGKVSKRNIKILFGIDSSGSISDKDFLDCLSEVKGVMNVYKAKIDWAVSDADIQDRGQLRPYSKIKIKFKGRGGTSFKPIFNLYNKDRSYDLLIYFTDMYGDESECHSYKPIIWVTTKDWNEKAKPKVGMIVNIT